MKFKYLLFPAIINGLLLAMVSHTSQAQTERPHELYLGFNASKSVYRTIVGGFSFDPEINYVHRGKLILGFTSGITQYYTGKDFEKNISNHRIWGYYVKPQVGIFLGRTFYMKAGGVYSQFKESLIPFIPGGYFGDFRGAKRRRDNLHTWGGELELGLRHPINDRITLWFSATLTIVDYPVVPPDPSIDELRLVYIPGAGSDAFSNDDTLNDQSGNFVSGNFGVKLFFKLNKLD